VGVGVGTGCPIHSKDLLRSKFVVAWSNLLQQKNSKKKTRQFAEKCMSPVLQLSSWMRHVLVISFKLYAFAQTLVFPLPWFPVLVQVIKYGSCY
jgi:hypothetical protein